MKTLAFILSLAFFASTIHAQVAECTFFYYEESGAEEKFSGFTSRFCPAIAIPDVHCKQEADYMAMHDFKKFGIYQALIGLLKEECLSVHSYKMVREGQRFDPEIHTNYSGQIDDAALRMVRNAKDGDRYILYDIQVRNKDGLIYRIPLIAMAQIKSNRV